MQGEEWRQGYEFLVRASFEVSSNVGGPHSGSSGILRVPQRHVGERGGGIPLKRGRGGRAGRDPGLHGRSRSSGRSPSRRFGGSRTGRVRFRFVGGGGRGRPSG